MGRRILILSASAGAGHLRAAEALEKALRRLDGVAEILNVDVLRYTNALFRNLYSKAYFDLVDKAPDVLGWLYAHFDKPWKDERVRLAFERLNLGPFIKLIKGYRPHVAVSTHFLPSEIISWLKGSRQIALPQAVVVTDFDVHAMWLCRHVERYFVPREETAVHLASMGVPQGKIVVSGIPIDPVFAELKERTAMRRKHDLAGDAPVLLMAGGGFGIGPVERLLECLTRIRHPVRIVAIAGRNAPLRRRFSRIAANAGRQGLPASVRVLGFTTEMDELMAAADLFVGKPGGLTSSEALARGLPLVIVNPIPGQEERNSDFLLEEGAAIKGNNLPALPWKIERLLDDPAALDRMRAHARRLARPDAALAVARAALTL